MYDNGYVYVLGARERWMRRLIGHKILFFFRAKQRLWLLAPISVLFPPMEIFAACAYTKT
jgi:hypothetical protein